MLQKEHAEGELHIRAGRARRSPASARLEASTSSMTRVLSALQMRASAAREPAEPRKPAASLRVSGITPGHLVCPSEEHKVD